MTLKLDIMGENIADVIAQAKAFIADNEGTAHNAPHIVSPQAKADQQAEQKAKLEAEHRKANDNVQNGGVTNEFDGILYGTKSNKRNAWLDLKDGRVIFIKAGGRFPEESEIEKRLTKGEYDKAIASGTEVALTIEEVVESWTNDDVEPANAPKKSKGSKSDTSEDEDDEEEALTEDAGAEDDEADAQDEVEDDDEDEAADDDSDDEEDEDEDDEDEEDEDYTVEEVKALAKTAKAIEGGKKLVRKLLNTYDVKAFSKLDNDDLQDVAEELEDFIEENED